MSHLVKQVLLSNAYWVLNKEVVKKLGLESAFILGVFADGESTLADENGWFYQTSATITELTGLTNHKQSQAISKLVEIGVLSQENRGVPCKRFFKINYENLEKLVFKNFENYSSKNLNTSIQKISNNKESIIKKVSKENNNTVVVPAFKQEIDMLIRANKLNTTVEKLLQYAEGDSKLVIKQIKSVIKSSADNKTGLLIDSLKHKYEISEKKKVDNKSEFKFDNERYSRIEKVVNDFGIGQLSNKDEAYYKRCLEHLRGE